MNNQDVFGVSLLGRPRKIKGTSYHRLAINDHDFAVSYGMGSVNPCRDPRVEEEVSRGVVL
jgi:hypothetical protein